MQIFDSHKIDQYLMGQMAPKEHLSFEQSIKENESLAKQVELRREAIAAIGLMGDFEMKKRLQDVHEAGVQLGRQEINRKKIRLASIAIIVSLILLSLWWVYQQKPSNEQIYADYFEQYELSFGNRNNQNQVDLFQFGQYYQEENYTAALAVRQQIPDSLVTSKIELATGMSLLSVGRNQEAAAIFNELLQQNDPIYTEQSRWYLALTFLAQNDLPACRQLLTEMLASDGHFKQAEAGELLEKLF